MALLKLEIYIISARGTDLTLNHGSERHMFTLGVKDETNEDLCCETTLQKSDDKTEALCQICNLILADHSGAQQPS